MVNPSEVRSSGPDPDVAMQRELERAECGLRTSERRFLEVCLDLGEDSEIPAAVTWQFDFHRRWVAALQRARADLRRVRQRQVGHALAAS